MTTAKTLERLNFTVLPADNELVYQAQNSISYADCFMLASAIAREATVVTGDPEFKKVEDLIKVIWV